MKSKLPLTLHPLSFEEALANLMAVKPSGQGQEVPPEAQGGPQEG